MESHLKLRLKSFIELGEPCRHPKMPVFGVALKMWGNVIFLFWQPQNLKHDLILLAFLKIILMIYIYFACRSVSWYIYILCLSVCFFVSNKRQNGWTDRTKILCVTSHDPSEVLWMLRITKNRLKIYFKIPEKILSHQRTFYFCFIQRERCSQKELQLK